MTLGADRLKQYGVPMKIEELLLAAGEPTDIDDVGRVDAHSLEGGTVSDGGNYEPPAVLEANEARSKRLSTGYGERC